MKLAYSSPPKESPAESRISSEGALVGNENVFSALKRGIELVLFYDPGKKANVMNDYGFPKTYLIKGEPGCGKTTAIKEAVRYGRELSAKLGRPLVVKNIGNTFKSEYYSLSAQHLRKMFSAFYSGRSAHVGIIEDVDTIFAKRNSIINNEDASNLGEMLNLLEGVETVNLGNYIIISTTNTTLEPALEQRLSECVLEAKGPETQEHYSQLVKINFKGLEKFVDSESLGEIMFAKRFSGRDVKNICRTICQQIMNVEVTPEIYALDSARQKTALEKNFRNISEKEAGGIVEGYERVKLAENGQ